MSYSIEQSEVMVSLHGLYDCLHTKCTLDSNFMKSSYINCMGIFETSVSVIHSHLNVKHASSEKNTSFYVFFCSGLKLSFVIFPIFHTLFLYVTLLTQYLSLNFWWHFFVLHSSWKYFKGKLFFQLVTFFIHTQTTFTPAPLLIFPKVTPQWTCGQACLGNFVVTFFFTQGHSKTCSTESPIQTCSTLGSSW